MNKQQFRRLKTVLRRGKSSNREAARDTQLTHLAHQKAAQLRANRRQNSRIRQRALSFASSFSIAVTITTFSFLIMSHIVAAPEQELFADQEKQNSVGDEQQNLTIARSVNSLPPGMLATPVARGQSRFYSADEILQEFSLPSPTELAQRMNFGSSTDQWAMVSTLSTAMADIAAMIGVGEFEQARDRYQRLRQSCLSCQLPDSLEKLALVRHMTDENI